jgi:hypothetical protein
VTAAQIGINDRALRNAAEKVAAIGYQGDPHRFVEALIVSVLGDGYRPIEPPIPLRPAGPIASEAVRADAKRHVADAVAAVREKRTTVNPPNEESQL